MPNYTYDDFTRAAEAAGLSGSFDASDLTTAQKYPEYGLSLVSLKRDLGNAQTAEQRLLVNEAMNQLRKNYGSYGVGEGANRSYATSYGSQISDALDKIGSYGPYSSAYGDQISQALSDIGSYGDFMYSQDSAYRDLLDRIINQQSFSYDPGTDPIFSSYKKAYNREGDRAAANALAAAAAATGGRASSYANMAAQQANNYYAGKLADIIPTLRSQALSEYNNQYDQLLRQMNTMASDRNSEYQLYLDRLSQMQQNLQNLQGQDATEYGRYENTLAQLQQDLENLQRQDATDYNRYLDELNAAYQRERDEATDRQNEFDNALKVYTATGQITGALADYLGGGSTYAGAAATYTGGGSSGGGRSYSGGSYTGSQSGNTPEAVQQEINDMLARYSTSQITGETYTDANGNPICRITSWEDYQRLKELTGATDDALNAAGISYAYPTTTDENGNLIPAVAYTTMAGGNPMTWEQVDAAGGNYQLATQTFETMRNGGASKEDVLAEIRAWYQDGDLTQSDYLRLYNQYRNMDLSEFGGSAATTPSTSGRATGNGTVKPGTRTPGGTAGTTATTNTGTGTAAGSSNAASGSGTSSILSRLGDAIRQAAANAEANPYAGYATDPLSASQILGNNASSASSSSNRSTASSSGSSGSANRSTSTGTVSAGTRTPSTSSTPAASSGSSSSSSSSSSGGLLTQLGNALRNAVQQANASAAANPYAGYATDPLSASQILGTSASSSSGSSNKSTSSSSSTKKATTTSKSTSSSSTVKKATSTSGGNSATRRTASTR
jgi:hypothetical protein